MEPQVEYYAADGHAYLWYPGNIAVVKSSYRENTETGEICFSYTDQVYDATTGDDYGEETCHGAAEFWAAVRETAEGDPFDLQTRQRAPFTLTDEGHTIESLRRRAGG